MLGFGLTVAAIGMSVVFAELVFLIFVIMLITKAAKLIANRKAPPASAEKTPENVSPAALAIAENAPDDAPEDIVAVIAAAVACLTQGRGVVKAIKRVQEVNGSAWGQAGRQETMAGRQ